MGSNNCDTCSKKTFFKGKDFEINKLRTRKFKDGMLLTNDCGKWCYLSDSEYKKFRFNDIDEKLYQKLKDTFMVLNDENIDAAAHQINDYYWYLGQGTSLHIVIPTLRCNFTCKYCYAFRMPEETPDVDMTPELMDKTIDFMFKSPSKSLCLEFSGGEPLIRFDLVKLGIERAVRLAKEKERDLTISIVTNGTYITEEMIPYFKKYKVGLCLSLDGPEEIHDSNRRVTKGNKPTYAKVKESINLLKKHKFPGLNSIPVIVKDSLPKWKEIVDEYVGVGFNVLRFKYVSRFGFASDGWDTMSYSPEEFLDSWKKVINYMIDLNKKGVQISENMASLILFKLITGINTNYAELMIPCGAVVGQVVYNYDGSIYTCDEARTLEEFKIGSVLESSYEDIINNPITKTLQSVSNLTGFNCDDDCAWFSFCGICPLEIYNQEKGLMTNIPSNYRHKIHEGMFDFLMDKLLFDPEAKEMLSKWPFLKKGLPGLSEKSEENANPFDIGKDSLDTSNVKSSTSDSTSETISTNDKNKDLQDDETSVFFD